MNNVAGEPTHPLPHPMYQRVPVDPSLAAYVREILVEDPAAEARPAGAAYRVLPGPYPVLGFQSRGRLDVLLGGGPETLRPSGITGLQRSFRWFRATADARSVLVVLHPAAGFALLGNAMDEVTDRHVGLADVLSPAWAAEVEERVAAAGSAEEVGRVVVGALRERIARAASPHPLVAEAARRLVDGRGGARIEALARDLGIGRRQMERLFRLHVGVAPKELAALARFHWAAGHLAARRSWSALAYDAGYADQSHFIRAFTARAGVTPEQHARGAAPPMSHSFNPPPRS